MVAQPNSELATAANIPDSVKKVVGSYIGTIDHSKTMGNSGRDPDQASNGKSPCFLQLGRVDQIRADQDSSFNFRSDTNFGIHNGRTIYVNVFDSTEPRAIYGNILQTYNNQYGNVEVKLSETAHMPESYFVTVGVPVFYRRVCLGLRKISDDELNQMLGDRCVSRRLDNCGFGD